MNTKKVYLPAGAIASHEDFNLYYEDGDVFLGFQGKWSSEKDKVAVIGRWGGEVGHIKPDHRTLTYYLRSEQYEHCLHTYTIFKHYYVEGMLWNVEGSIAEGSFSFMKDLGDGDAEREGRVRRVTRPGLGECLEISVKDAAKLRIAAIAVVAMAIKEEWKGLSEGEELEDPTFLQKLKANVFSNKGKTYEQILAEQEASA